MLGLGATMRAASPPSSSNPNWSSPDGVSVVEDRAYIRELLQLAVMVVDEAILALTGYQLLDPVTTFYYARPSDLSSRYGRSSIILVDPTQLAGSRQALATQTLNDAGAIMEAPMMEMAVEESAAMPAAEAV